MDKQKTFIKKETKPMYSYSGSHGKSTAMIDCPFCDESVLVYIWSLNGSGKKCTNCGALLTMGMAFKEKQNA